MQFMIMLSVENDSLNFPCGTIGGFYSNLCKNDLLTWGQKFSRIPDPQNPESLINIFSWNPEILNILISWKSWIPEILNSWNPDILTSWI